MQKGGNIMPDDIWMFIVMIIVLSVIPILVLEIQRRF